jgi:hypothetical protein
LIVSAEAALRRYFKIFLKLPVNEGVLGVLQGIKVEQTYNIWWQVVPDKLLHGVHPAENLFEKLIMGVGDFRHKQNLPHLLCKSSSHIGDPGSCELGKYRTQGLRVPERTLFLILFRHFTERYLPELIDKIFTRGLALFLLYFKVKL